MTALPHLLERTVVIRATPEAVFRFFTDGERWAAWWGKGSTIDARPRGQVRIRYPDGSEASGEVLEISAPRRIVFSYGYANGQMIAPGGSRVTIQMEAAADGTRLSLVHEFADAAARDHHQQGWRYQLSLFGNVVAGEVYAAAAEVVDRWFEAWATTDTAQRAALLARTAVPDVRFRDRFGATDGLDDLVPHIGAAQQFMPGIRLSRKGDVRHCQGTVLADWSAAGADGKERASGASVFVLSLDGRIASATGFWN